MQRRARFLRSGSVRCRAARRSSLLWQLALWIARVQQESQSMWRKQWRRGAIWHTRFLRRVCYETNALMPPDESGSFYLARQDCEMGFRDAEATGFALEGYASG